MRKMLFTVAAAAACALAAPAFAGEQDFVLINGTGYTIQEVYVSPTKTQSWEEDVLGRDVLGDGARTTIRFDRAEDTCLWDLKAVYEDGETAEWQAFDLCEVSVVAISYDEDTGRTTAHYE